MLTLRKPFKDRLLFGILPFFFLLLQLFLFIQILLLLLHLILGLEEFVGSAGF